MLMPVQPVLTLAPSKRFFAAKRHLFDPTALQPHVAWGDRAD